MQKLKLKSKELKEKGNKKNDDMPWTKFYPDRVPDEIVFPDTTMVGYLLDSVSRYPENKALEFYGSSYTFRELYERVRTAAASLKAQGVKQDTSGFP